MRPACDQQNFRFSTKLLRMRVVSRRVDGNTLAECETSSGEFLGIVRCLDGGVLAGVLE